MGLLLSAHLDPHPSRWVRRFAPLIKPGGGVLDVACGSGRHVRWLAEQGFRVTGVDRDEAAALPLRDRAEIVIADIEAGPWPLPGRRFDAVVVTNYLWRALLPKLRGSLADGGVLIYETFAVGQETIGKPRSPEFLLQAGELLRAFSDLRVVAFEDGFETDPERFVQRIAAVNALPPGATPPRHGLAAPRG